MEVNNQFVEEYEKEYFRDGDRSKAIQVKRCGLLRSSRYPEKEIERILREGIKNAKDVVHILAWKTGKINHKKCTKETPFSYCGRWKELGECKNWADAPDTVKLWKSQFPIKDIAQYVSDSKNLERWETYICQDRWFDVLNELEHQKKERHWKGIGVVYFLTLLYFISKGKYPIYDQFVDKALNSIYEEEKNVHYRYMPSTLPKKEEYLQKLKDRYLCYCMRIEKLKKELDERYQNPTDRSLDRALWVYGHTRR